MNRAISILIFPNFLIDLSTYFPICVLQFSLTTQTAFHSFGTGFRRIKNAESLLTSPVSRTNPEYIRSSGAHRGETQRGRMGERGIPVCPRGENWRWVPVASGEEEGLIGRGAIACNIIL